MDTKLFRDALQKVFDHASQQLGTIRTGRATPALVEQVMVSAYNTKMPLRELASIAAPEPRQLLIQAWDANLLKEIEKGIMAANLGMTPSIDGTSVRVSLPALTEETRKEQLKLMREKIEEAKVATRRERDTFLKQAREEEKEGLLSEDTMKLLDRDVTKEMDAFTEKLESAASAKEQELMTL